MAEHLIRYLVETEIHLRREMPSEQLRDTLAETEQHLRERIAAMEELGLGEEEAEREAVTAFGPSWRYAADLLEAHRPVQNILDARVLKWAAAGMTALAAFILLLDWPFWQACLMAGTLAVVMVLLASVRSRSFIPVSLFILVSTMSLLTWLMSPMAVADLTSSGGLGIARHAESQDLWSRWAIANESARLAEYQARHFEGTPDLEKAAYAAGFVPTRVSTLGNQPSWRLQLPERSWTTGGPSEIWVGNSDQAVHLLRSSARSRRNEANSIQEVAMAYEQWREGTYAQKLAANRSVLAICLGVGFLALLSANLLGALLGRLVQMGKRRRMARV